MVRTGRLVSNKTPRWLVTSEEHGLQKHQEQSRSDSMNQPELSPVEQFANEETQAAWGYHRATNHSLESVQRSSHRMEWDNQPMPFKIYPSLEGERLSGALTGTGIPAVSALSLPPVPGDAVPTAEDMAALLFYTGGVTKVGTVAGGGKLHFRAAACTGALYHIEIYLVCGPLSGVDAGVYHFGPHDFALRKLRDGDYRQVLSEATGGEPAVAKAPAALIFTSVFWRNSWKYQARAYRHSFWDSGTMLANLFAVGAGRGLPLKLVSTFVDSRVNGLLGLDADREAALEIVPVGSVGDQPLPDPPEVEPLDLEVQPYSRWEVDYPAVRGVHTASSLASGEQVAVLWDNPPLSNHAPASGPEFSLVPVAETGIPEQPLEETIRRRGSSRRFRRDGITFAQLSVILRGASGTLDADFLGGSDGSLNQLYLIVNQVDGLPAGSYVYHPDGETLEQLAEGDFRRQAGYLDLGQELAADASVNVYILTDLEAVLQRYGNRGYRMAQMEAAIRGGRLYLGAYAQRLGATGLTFFDDDVTRFFSPHAAGKSVMFLVALGRPMRRGRNIPIRGS